jgi:hypothetical protein
MAKETTSKEVAVKEDTKAVALKGYDMDSLIADSGLGSENLSAGDIAIPYLAILQGLSPQINEGKDQFIPGASASMFFNTVSNELYEGRKEGIWLVPCAYHRAFVEWTPREAGGGYVAEHSIDGDILEECVKNDKNQWVLGGGKGNLIVETAYQYCLLLNMKTGETERVVFALKSTALKANRKWNHAISNAKIPGHNVQAPRFLFAYNCKTHLEEKNGNSWWSPSFERSDDPVSPAVYAEAKDYSLMVKAGEVKLAPEPASDVDGAGDTGEYNNSADGVEKDIPF